MPGSLVPVGQQIVLRSPVLFMGCSTVKEVVEGPARQLQEAVVEELCGKLLQMDPRVTAVQVYLRKPHVPLPGVMESVGGWVLWKQIALL